MMDLLYIAIWSKTFCSNLTLYDLHSTKSNTLPFLSKTTRSNLLLILFIIIFFSIDIWFIGMFLLIKNFSTFCLTHSSGVRTINFFRISSKI